MHFSERSAFVATAPPEVEQELQEIGGKLKGFKARSVKIGLLRGGTWEDKILGPCGVKSSNVILRGWMCVV